MQDPSLPPVPKFDFTLPKFEANATDDVPVAGNPRKIVRPPKPQEPPPKKAETLGFITNMPRSILNMTKGLFVDLPVAVGTTAYNYAKNPGQYAKDASLMFSGKSGLAELLWHEMSDYYTKDFWYNFNEDPGRFLQDAATVASGIGLVGKGSKIGQVASKAGTWLDPMSASFKLAGKALAKPLEAIGIGDETQAIERIARTRAGAEAVEAAEAVKKHLFDGLTPPQKEEMRRLLMLGDVEEIAVAKARQDEVGRRYRNWRDRIDNVEQPYLKDRQNLLTDEDMLEANAKGVEVFTTSEDWVNSGGAIIMKDQAKDMIRDGILDPTFLRLFRLKNQSLDLFDALNEFGTGSNKVLSRLEKRFGRGEYLKDVDEIMSRQIQSFHNAKYKLGLLDEVRQYLASKNKILLARTEQEVEKAKALGYRKLEDEFYRKYWQSYNRATQILVEELKRAAATGENTAQALLRAKEEFSKLEGLGKAERLLDKAEVYVPAHVAAWLNRELAPISKGWQMYEKWMSRVKSVMTVFNPRYWSSVIFGNALLATMYGLSPDMARIAWKYRGDMPVALKQLAQHEIFLRDKGIFDRVAKSFGEAAGRLDELAKNGIFVSEIAKAVAKNFYISQADLIAAVKYYAEAPELLAKARTEIAELQAKAAIALQTKDKEYRFLKRAEKRLEFEIAKLMELTQTSFEELSTAISSRAERLGKAFGAVESKGMSPDQAKSILERMKKVKEGYYKKADRIDELEKKRGDLIADEDAIQMYRDRIGGEESGVLPDPLEEIRYRLDEIERERRILNYDEARLAAIERETDSAQLAYNKSKLEFKYTYFVHAFQDELKKLTSTLKNAPHQIDNAGVIGAIDSAIKYVEMGKPELLRYAVKRLKKAVRGESPLVQRRARLDFFVERVGRAEERVKSATADFLQRAAQSGQLSKRLPELERAAAVADKAIDTANRFYGSYNSLLPFERQVLRRIIPFYTFTKAMTKLAFQFPFLYPKRTFVITNLTRAWNDLMHDENAFMPSWSKNYIPIAGTEEGGVVMMRVGSFTPMANVRMTGFAGHEMPSIMDIATQHPFIRVMFEMKGGIPDWTKRPLSPGDRAVRLDNGEVVEFSGKGFKTVIAQPSVWKSIFGMFPQSQLIHSLMSQYAQTDRGWLFNPDPIRTPYGKARYPKELSDILLSYTLAPTTTVEPAALQRRERVYAGLVAREFQREIRTASPERRTDLIHALRSWQIQRKQAVER